MFRHRGVAAAPPKPSPPLWARSLLPMACCLMLLVGASGWPNVAAALPVGQPGALPAAGAVGTRLGTHILLEVTSAPFERLNSSQLVLAAMHAAIKAGGLTVVGELAHQFPVMGFSAVLMIRCVCVCVCVCVCCAFCARARRPAAAPDHDLATRC